MEGNRGFFTKFHFPAGIAKKTPKSGRRKLKKSDFTDNPKLSKISYMTDDSSEDEQLKRVTDSVPGRNKILDTSSSLFKSESGSDETFCSSLEKENAPDTVKRTQFSSYQPSNTMKSPEEKKLCSQMGSVAIHNQKKAQKLSESLFSTKSSQLKVSDTIVEAASPEPNAQEKPVLNLNDTDVKLTLSNEIDSQNDEDSIEIIDVLDSDEEEDFEVVKLPEKNPNNPFINCSSSSGTINDFFNNPPSIDCPVTRSYIENARKNINEKVVEKVRANTPVQSLNMSDREHVEIPATDKSNILDDSKEEPEQIKETPVQKFSKSITIETPKSSGKGKRQIANIAIDFSLKIRIQEYSSDEEEKQPSEGKKSKSKSIRKSNSSPSLSTSVNRQLQAIEPAPENPKLLTRTQSEDVHTPSKMHVIDNQLQTMLDEMYGDSWKTPEVMKSFKIVKKPSHPKNFESFIKHRSSDLESTRLSPASFKKPDTPVSKPKSVNKPVSSNKKPTPKFFDFCDSDTPTESGSDEEYNPNDTWNASSDEEYKSETDRIKKRSLVRQSLRNPEIIFIRDDSIEEQQKLDKLLERCEFKKPDQIGSGKKKAVSKRKLFTDTYGEDDEVQDDKENRKEPVKPQSPVIRSPYITPVNKKKIEKTTPAYARFEKFNFLKSLDAEVNRSLCDADALFYRDNFKTKKIELAEKLFKLYNEKVFDSKLSNVPIKWNKKLLNTAGRCNNSRRGTERQSSLELSEKVLTSADRLRCTLIHEMCHASTWILNGENGHGATWKRWAAKANAVFPELPKIAVCHNYTIFYRFTYLCVHCKAKYQAHSKNKKVEEIRCSICKGSIELFENKQNDKGEIVMTPVQKKEVTGFAKFVQLKYKEFKRPNVQHKDVMKILSAEFGKLTTEEKSSI